MPDRSLDSDTTVIAVPAPDVQPTPEPLVKAETVRALVLAIVAAGGAGSALPDPVLAVVVPIVTTVLGVGVSWGLTMVARGKVWALRRGVDVDQVIDDVQARAR